MQIIKLFLSSICKYIFFKPKMCLFLFVHCIFSITNPEKHKDSYKEAIGR